MRPHRLIIAALGCMIAATLAGCGKPSGKTDSSRDVAAIKAIEAQWTKDFTARDAAAFASHYAPDAVAMNPGSPPLVGRSAIEASEKQALADPAASSTSTSEKVGIAASGDLAYSQGTFTDTFTDPATHKALTVSGEYLTVFKKAPDGSWQAIYDINTPSSGMTFAGLSKAPPMRRPGRVRRRRRRHWW